jgi:hypothetical protein
MNFPMLAFFGMGPMGSLLSGCLAGVLGTAATQVFTCGAVAMMAGLVFAALLPELRRTVRPISPGGLDVYDPNPGVAVYQRSD